MLTFSAALGTAPTPSGATNEVTAHTKAAGATTQSQLRERPLALSDLPTGWSPQPVSIGKGSQSVGDSTCSVESLPKKDVRVTADFVHAPDNSVLVESLEAGPNVAAAYNRLVTGMSVCHLDLLGVWKKVSFPSVGSDSSAYASSYSHDRLVINDSLSNGNTT